MIFFIETRVLTVTYRHWVEPSLKLTNSNQFQYSISLLSGVSPWLTDRLSLLTRAEIMSPFSRGGLNIGILNSEREIEREIQCDRDCHEDSRSFFILCSSWLIVHSTPESTGPACHQGRHVRNRSHCVFARAANALDLAARWVDWGGCTSFIAWDWVGGGNNLGCLHLHTYCTSCYAAVALGWSNMGTPQKKALLRIWQEQQAIRSVVGQVCCWKHVDGHLALYIQYHSCQRMHNFAFYGGCMCAIHAQNMRQISFQNTCGILWLLAEWLKV